MKRIHGGDAIGPDKGILGDDRFFGVFREIEKPLFFLFRLLAVLLVVALVKWIGEIDATCGIDRPQLA